MLGLTTALLISGILGALGTAGAGITSAVMNKQAQDKANDTNIQLQREANEAQLQQVQMTNEFNAAEAQKARDYNTLMSNTQYQRAVADLQAAGLNPLLAAGSGAAASYSTPASASGAVANVGAARVNPATMDLSSLSSAFQSMTNMLQTMALLEVKHDANDIRRYGINSMRPLAGAKSNYYNTLVRKMNQRY